MKKYAKTLKEAKAIFKTKTGQEYAIPNHNNIRIFTLSKKNQTPTRKYYIGSNIEFINR